jgi:hypothetical protein
MFSFMAMNSLRYFSEITPAKRSILHHQVPAAAVRSGHGRNAGA